MAEVASTSMARCKYGVKGSELYLWYKTAMRPLGATFFDLLREEKRSIQDKGVSFGVSIFTSKGLDGRYFSRKQNFASCLMDDWRLLMTDVLV